MVHEAVLVMYLTIYLAYSSDESTLIYHTFSLTVYMMSILGAVLADSWLGKYCTVLSMSSVFAVGLVVLNLGSIASLNMPGREFTIFALILIAVSSGAMKPCMTAFGGDQFKLPQQQRQMARYYSLYFMVLKLSFLGGATLAPVLRQDVQCLGNDHCFPLAFGVPGLFIIVTVVVLLLGNRYYVKLPATGNILVLVIKCIWVRVRCDGVVCAAELCSIFAIFIHPSTVPPSDTRTAEPTRSRTGWIMRRGASERS